MNEAVTYAVDDDGVCTLTLDLPGRTMNVIDAELQLALAVAIDRAATDRAVRGIILTSGKPAFVAGADLGTIDGGNSGGEQSAAALVEQSSTLSRDLRRLETCGKPVACAINGTALGGGLEIALACHYRVAVENPKTLLGLPEATLGLLPGGGGTQRLPRLLGLRAALPLLLQGTMMDPAKALQAGLVHAVVPPGDLLATAKRWLVESGDPVAPWDRKGYAIPGGAGALDPDTRALFSVGNLMSRAGSYGNNPAAAAISAAVYEGTQLPMDAALRIEAKYFVSLLTGPVSRAMVRTMFINKGKADKLLARPSGIAKKAYTTIGILGAGTMGAGLALTAAKAGLDVVLLDRDLSTAARGRDHAAGRLAREVRRGRLTQEKADAVMARVRATDSYAPLADAQIVVEAVFEDREVKRDVIRRAEAVLGGDAVFATNTSAMPITGLSEFSSRPDQFIGMHFFSPVEKMALVEIIRGDKTSDATLAYTLDLARALRKTPIVVNDGPGFFTSRFIGSFVAESLRMVQEGINPSLVENGARMLGMPMGALAISDSIGLDVGYHAGRQQAKDAGLPEPEPGIIGVLVADHGRHGVKNGKGFYDYAADGTKTLWPGLAQLYPRLSEQPPVAEIKQRILYVQLVEGARCFAEGVLSSVIDGDLGATLGVGFPTYLGGPFCAIDTIGLGRFVAEADRLAARYGGKYALPDIVREMAADGRTFHGPNAVASPGARGSAEL